MRTKAGVFDVSHMGVVDISGTAGNSKAFLRRLLANDVARLVDGQAQYSLMLNPAGGVVDDLIVYRLGQDRFRLVINCANCNTDLDWMRTQAGSLAALIQLREDIGILALQGPRSTDILSSVVAAAAAGLSDLKTFHFLQAEGLMISRTGYTGEDGYEIFAPVDRLEQLWKAMMHAGVSPIGLGARDTLRLEAGLCLYGQEMDQSTSPLSCNLGWTVAWNPESRDFTGRQALEKERSTGAREKLVGLVLQGRGIARSGAVVMDAGKVIGQVTSGTFSPTLGKGIALARARQEVPDQVSVELRGKSITASVVRPVFVRHGKPIIGR